MDTDGLKRNLYAVRSSLEKASGSFGRQVTLVAATKTVPADLIDELVRLGVARVGENRVQEYLAKKDAVTGAKWHFIGTLQRNKAKYLVGDVELIQSVSSAANACEIDRLARLRGVVQDVLAEFNVGGEESKTGADFGEADELIGKLLDLKNVRLRGLMTVPPRDAPDGIYKKIYALYSRYESGAFDTLSVGMSGDYEKAIAFGSNMVRLGTALFGQRNY